MIIDLNGDVKMLYMIIVKASRHSEVSQRPSLPLREQMDEYNEKLEAAGVKRAAYGLVPTDESIRYKFDKEGNKQIFHGPYSFINEQIAGFFIIEVKSKEEAMKWFSDCPDPMGEGEGQIELRQIIA